MPKTKLTLIMQNALSQLALTIMWKKVLVEYQRIKDHNGRDHTSQLWNHSREKSHENVNIIKFKITNKNFHNKKRKRNIAEGLWIKDLRTTFNTQ